MSWECTPAATNTRVYGQASLGHGHQGAEQAMGRKMLHGRETQLDFHCGRWLCVEQNCKRGRTRARPGMRMRPHSRWQWLGSGLKGTIITSGTELWGTNKWVIKTMQWRWWAWSCVPPQKTTSLWTLPPQIFEKAQTGPRISLYSQCLWCHACIGGVQLMFEGATNDRIIHHPSSDHSETWWGGNYPVNKSSR